MHVTLGLNWGLHVYILSIVIVQIVHNIMLLHCVCESLVVIAYSCQVHGISYNIILVYVQYINYPTWRWTVVGVGM